MWKFKHNSNDKKKKTLANNQKEAAEISMTHKKSKKGLMNFRFTDKRKTSGNLLNKSVWIDSRTRTKGDGKGSKLIRAKNAGSCGEPWSLTSLKSIAYKKKKELRQGCLSWL